MKFGEGSKLSVTTAIIDDNDGVEIHTRRVTILLQAHRSSFNGGGGGGGSGSNNASSQMSKLTFTNVFDHHTPEEMEKLDRVYAECHGKIPSRRQLSAIAQAINIQQSKIKKWFEKRAAEQEASHERGNDNFWSDLNKKMDEIDHEIARMQAINKDASLK